MDKVTGQITLEELKQMQKEWMQDCVHNLLKLRDERKWQDFVDFALFHPECLWFAFNFYNEVPDELKYEFAIHAYSHHGDSIPKVRKAVRSALKYGKPIFPPEIQNAEEITVYRAGEEPIQKAKYRISWTTDINTALFFLNTYNMRHAQHLYQAKIKPCKVIAYYNDRDESEIMQYGNVYDIVDITATATQESVNKKGM